MNKFWKIHSNHCPGAETRSQKNHWKSNINNLWYTQVFGCPWKSPHFQKAPLFTAWCCALMSTWLLTVHWASLTVSLSADWCLLTLVPAQTQPAGPAPQYYWPSHTTRNVNTSQSDKKKLEEKFIILPPTWTLWPNYNIWDEQIIKFVQTCKIYVDIGKIHELHSLTELPAHALAGPGTSS